MRLACLAQRHRPALSDCPAPCDLELLDRQRPALHSQAMSRSHLQSLPGDSIRTTVDDQITSGGHRLLPVGSEVEVYTMLDQKPLMINHCKVGTSKSSLPAKNPANTVVLTSQLKLPAVRRVKVFISHLVHVTMQMASFGDEMDENKAE